MPIDPAGKAAPGPNVPKWRRPLFTILDSKVRNKNLSKEEIQKEAQDVKVDDELRNIFPSKLKWLAPVVVFILRRNPVEAIGIGAVAVGALSLIVSFLKPLLKWGGIALGGLGVIAAIGGKLCGINLKAPGSGSNTPRTSGSSDDDITWAAGAAAAAFHDGHDGHGDCSDGGGGDGGGVS